MSTRSVVCLLSRPSMFLCLGLAGGCVDLGALGKDDGEGGGDDGSGEEDEDPEPDCDALVAKQYELPPECQTLVTLRPSVRGLRRVVLSDGIGVNDPGESRGEDPILWRILPEGSDFGPGIGAASTGVEAAAVWDRARLQPDATDDDPDLLLQSPNEDGFGNALVGMIGDGGQVRMLVSSTAGEYVERYAVTPESFPDEPFGVAPPALEGTVEVESIAAVEAAWTAPVGLELGVSIADGDFDGDGHRDVAMTAPGEGDGGTLYLSYGPHERVTEVTVLSSRLHGSAAVPVRGPLANVGDVDGDGADDLALGVPQAEDGAGGVVLIRGLGGADSPAEALDAVGSFLPGTEGAGAAITGIWDVDGDGVNDVAVGSPADSTQGEGAGAVFVISGQTLLDGGGGSLAEAALGIVYGESEGAALGTSLAVAGDTNGDGRLELLIGAPFALDLEGVETGAIYLADELDGTGFVGQAGQGFTVEGEGARFGESVDAGVDFDADGFPDLAAYEAGTGELVVVFGVGAGR